MTNNKNSTKKSNNIQIFNEKIQKMSEIERQEYYAKCSAKRKASKEKEKILSNSLKKIINGTYIDEKDGSKLTIADKMNIAIALKAMQGDIGAYSIIRDTVGEKPTDKVESDNRIEIVLGENLEKLAK